VFKLALDTTGNVPIGADPLPTVAPDTSSWSIYLTSKNDVSRLREANNLSFMNNSVLVNTHEEDPGQEFIVHTVPFGAPLSVIRNAVLAVYSSKTETKPPINIKVKTLG
jgi:hypothetical protein